MHNVGKRSSFSNSSSLFLFSYPNAGYSERVNYYSNPDVNFNGNPSGTNNDNNARVIRENRFDQAARGDESGTCGNYQNYV